MVLQSGIEADGRIQPNFVRQIGVRFKMIKFGVRRQSTPVGTCQCSDSGSPSPVGDR